MSNKKITQLPINGNPTFSDVFPIVNDGITKQLSLTGLTAFIEPYINAVTPPFTGGTVSGATIFTNGLTANTISATTYLGLPSTSGLYLPLSGGTVSGGTIFTNGVITNTISATTYVNLPTDIRVTGGTISEDIIVFTNNTGGTFSVTGLTSNVKHWVENKTLILKSDETLVISGDYVLVDTNLDLEKDTEITIGSLTFNKYAQIYIGGNLLLLNSNIINDGLINVAGAIIFSGDSTITGLGIIN
jgi:hypothetical protein